MAMNVQQLCSKLVRPVYNGDTTAECVPLSVFDRFTYDSYIPLIYAYKLPNPSNKVLEQGIQKALSEYRELAGRFYIDGNGRRVILLNDEGLRFVEAYVDCTLDEVMPFKPSTLISLNPSFEGVKELALVQLTRFSCGSLVVGFSRNHMLADGFSTSQFLVAWGQACRGLEIEQHPLHDRTIFVPRDPPKVEFEHRSIEFTKREIKEELSHPDNPSLGDDLIYHKAHFTPKFIAKLKSEASSLVSGVNRPYSTFVSLVAHLWRIITRVRGLDEFQRTRVRIAVNGRRRLIPRVPDEYFGNLVLWASPKAQVKVLLHERLSNAAKIIHEGVAKLNDDYFKSFIDFASSDIDEDLIAEAHKYVSFLCPDFEVNSWLGFPFGDVDFGFGKPYIFMPSFYPLEGLVFLVPSIAGDGGIDVFITLFQHQLTLFEEMCYSIDEYQDVYHSFKLSDNESINLPSNFQKNLL